jgi:hypothetical protein
MNVATNSRSWLNLEMQFAHVAHFVINETILCPPRRASKFCEHSGYLYDTAVLDQGSNPGRTSKLCFLKHTKSLLRFDIRDSSTTFSPFFLMYSYGF